MIFFEACATLVVHHKRSFQILYLRGTLYIHLSILILFTLIPFSCHFVVPNVSAPYIIAGLTSFVAILLRTICPSIHPISPTWSHWHCDPPFPHNIPLLSHPEAFEMSNSFQFLSYYLHRLSVSLFMLFESKIHELSFQPANPHPPFSSSDCFHVSRYPAMFTSLDPQDIALQCRLQKSWILVVISSPHP